MPRKQKSDDRDETINAVDMLQAQHRAVERLFEQLSRGSDGRDRRPALLDLADLLSAHSVIEERHFYPAVRSSSTAELIDEAYEEHMEVKRLLLHLLDVGPEDEEFGRQLEELQAMVEDHVQEEENELFPRVQDLLSSDQLEGLAQEMTATLVELQAEGPPHEQLAADLHGN